MEVIGQDGDGVHLKRLFDKDRPEGLPQAIDDHLLACGKTKMSALGAAMQKLVHLCFGVIKTRHPYQADYALSA